MKRIIVTGAKGGTGTGIVSVLHAAGCDVVQTDIRPPGADDGPEYIQHDLRSAEGLSDIFADADGVIHFGSPPHDQGMSTTEAFHHLTVAGFNVFQAAKNAGIRRITWASSIEVYGDFIQHSHLPVTEDSPKAPPGIYGCSKLLLERLAEDYCRWYGMAIAGFRLTRIFYDNDFGRAKLKRFVDDAALGGDALWSYIGAHDVGRACLAWLQSDCEGAHAFNIAAANVHHDADTVDLLKKHGYADCDVPVLAAPDAALLSSEKFRTMTGWSARDDWRELL